MEGQSQEDFEGCWETIREPKRSPETREKSTERGEWKNRLCTKYLGYLKLAVTVRGACTERLLLFIQLSLFNGSSHEWVKIKAEKMRIKWMFKACIYFL